MVAKTDDNPETPDLQDAQEQDKLRPESSSSHSASPNEARKTHSDTAVEPLAPATNPTDVEIAQPNCAEGKRPKSPKQKRLIKMLKRKEIIFFLIGGVTFSLGLILVIVALLIMQGKCEKQPYWVSNWDTILSAIGYYRADSRFVPSQWETSLQSNAVSRWLGANLESALVLCALV